MRPGYRGNLIRLVRMMNEELHAMVSQMQREIEQRTARSTFLKPALFQPPDCFPQHAVAKVSLSHVEQF
jgi:hypothetical protein